MKNKLTKKDRNKLIDAFNTDFIIKKAFPNTTANEFARIFFRSKLKYREFCITHYEGVNYSNYYKSKREERIVKYRIAKRKYRIAKNK